jgi:ribosomal protein S18 acetylase RimI-like enzyme
MHLWDIPEVVEFFQQFPSVSFCDWQSAQLLAQSPQSCCIARDGKRLVGALLAGLLGTRATVSHVAVAEEYQGQGIGRMLVAHALASFRDAGVLRVFLFVLSSETAALRFWQAAGFHVTAGEVTMERDL